MPYKPSASELSVGLAELLEDVLLPALPAALQHQARVGAHIARILERELATPPHIIPADPTWADLVDAVRSELAVVKPAYDEWEGE